MPGTLPGETAAGKRQVAVGMETRGDSQCIGREHTPVLVLAGDLIAFISGGRHVETPVGQRLEVPIPGGLYGLEQPFSDIQQKQNGDPEAASYEGVII